MTFSVTNTSVSFQEMIHAIFPPMKACVWDVDNIHIYSEDIKAEHQAIVEKALQQYVEHGLVVNLHKNELHLHKTIFVTEYHYWIKSCISYTLLSVVFYYLMQLVPWPGLVCHNIVGILEGPSSPILTKPVFQLLGFSRNRFPESVMLLLHEGRAASRSHTHAHSRVQRG